MDLLLMNNGDLAVTEEGDIVLTDSIVQAVKIRLRWIAQEWRLGPQYGFPWFEEVFIKNPDVLKIAGLIRNEAVQVEGVDDARVNDISFDPASRSATFYITVVVGEEEYQEEVSLYG